jgi:hypothetical protein
MNVKEAMESGPKAAPSDPHLYPRTIVVTDELINNQPTTRDPYEIDVGHNELVEDESDENE